VDIERVAAFNGLIHGSELAVTMRRLLRDYAGMEGRDIIFVENAATGEVVSSLVLLPWTLRCGGIPLPVGEMGMVGTLESHRGQGLVRIQTEYFMQRLRAHGCLLSLIQGIPYFYRQFGYEYAMPLEGGLRLSGRELPAPPAAALPCGSSTTRLRRIWPCTPHATRPSGAICWPSRPAARCAARPGWSRMRLAPSWAISACPTSTSTKNWR
jgi:hypothetical protein